MARHSRRHRSRSRKMKGGDSAASWGVKVNGPVDAQLNRVFGPQYAGVPGNVIIGAQGQNLPPASQIPTSAQLSAAQSGGKRNDIFTEPFNKLTQAVNQLAEALNQPVFPFAYLKQQTNKGGNRRTRKQRKH